MTGACNSGVENAIERFPPRSSTSTKALFSALQGEELLIQLCKKTVKFPIVQKIQGFGRVVPNTQTAQKSSKVLTEFKLELQETPRSVLMLPLSS